MRAPADLRPDDLVLSHFSLHRSHPIDDRIAAAAAAGFAGIGLFIGDYLRLKQEGVAPGRLAELLDEAGVCLAEIEVVNAWPKTSREAEHAAAYEAAAWEMADRFGCRYLQVIGPTAGTTAEAAAAFGALCDRAAEHGLVAGIEFLPFTDIVTAADALAIVDAADRENGGVCIDIWHHRRGANDMALIRAVPAGKVMAVQVSDGPLRQEQPGESYVQDCLRRRRPPGDGEMEVATFVGALIEMGVRVPWSVEACDERVWGRPAGEHCHRCADGMRAVLDDARQGAAVLRNGTERSGGPW